jgi:hypothetical protein
MFKFLKKKLVIGVGQIAAFIGLFVFVFNVQSLSQLIADLRKKESPSLEIINKKHDIDMYSLIGDISDCSFPDLPSVSAPSWICTESSDELNGNKKNIVFALGFSNLKNGESKKDAYMSALSSIDSKVRMKISMSMTEETSNSKSVIEHKLTSRINIRDELLSDWNIHKGNSGSILFQLTYKNSDCRYKYFAFKKSNNLEKTENITAYEDDITLNCSFENVVRELESVGISAVKSTISPSGFYYLLLANSKQSN